MLLTLFAITCAVIENEVFELFILKILKYISHRCKMQSRHNCKFKKSQIKITVAVTIIHFLEKQNFKIKVAFKK